MLGYTKNIAVIRGLKNGFSADGGNLSGLVKCEKYGSNLKVEASLINFAPLSQGKYVCAVSDGKKVCVLDDLSFDGVSEVDTSEGFASLICFVNDGVFPIASAVCGAFHSAAIGIKEEIERQEKIKNIKYEDDALAQENYYEFGQNDKDGGAVREDKEEEKNGGDSFKNEEDKDPRKTAGGLFTGGKFYERMRGEIERVLNSYPAEEGLEKTIENSKWVRISYGDEKYYVFGVIFLGGEAQYICYGVPYKDQSCPPPHLENSSFIPAYPEGNWGYWIMYQDAKTGASIKIEGK